MKENELVEQFAAKFHDIYQVEAKKQGDVRHKDSYSDLPENIKEFDRVLARYVISYAATERAGMREACAKFGDEGGCNCDYPEIQGKHGHASYCPLGISAAIRSLPDTAADEVIERVKAAARLEALTSFRDWHTDPERGGYADIGSNVSEEELDRRIAALTAAAKETP